MIRKLFRRGLRIGAVVGGILFLIQVFTRNPPPKRSGSGDRPTPSAGTTRTAGTTATATETRAWVEPEGGVCPTSHPVKVKLSSGIFHVPGGLAYERTAPDRCYQDAASAEADGFRPSKR